MFSYEPFEGSGGGGAGEGGSGGSDALLPCEAVPTFADGLAPSRVIFVSPEGDDGGDGSEVSPLATLGAALDAATPGTAIRLQPGRYAGVQRNGVHGQEGAPIWIGAADPSMPPVIDSGAVGIHLQRSSYIVIHDLEITATDDSGIQIDDGQLPPEDRETCHHIVVRDVVLHDLGAMDGACIRLYGVDDFVVHGSQVAKCGIVGFSNGIVGIGHRGLVARNRIETQSTTGVAFSGGSENIDVVANHFIAAGARAIQLGGGCCEPEGYRPPLEMGVEGVSGRNLRAIANVIEGSQAPFALVNCVQCTLANNTVIDPRQVDDGVSWIIRILDESDGFLPDYGVFAPQQGSIQNNLFYFEAAQISSTLNLSHPGQETDFNFSHNLWFAHDDPAQSAPDLGMGTQSSAIVGEDPGFTSGFAIDATSPAAGAGTDVMGVEGDFAGRCYRDPPSIGAYEVP